MRAALAALALLLVTPANGAVLCVNPGGTGGCFASIQTAVDAALSEDEIEVAAGTYTEAVVIAAGERLTIRGAAATLTTIDGKIQVDPGARLTITDLGITGAGNGLEVRDARMVAERVRTLGNQLSGVYVLRSRVELIECSSTGNGLGGVFVTDTEGFCCVRRKSRVRIVRSTVAGNGFDGLNVNGAQLTLEDSTISGNARRGIDTGLSPVRLSIRRSTITGNHTDDFNGGGGILVHQNRGVIQSSIVAGNTATAGRNDIFVDVGVPRSWFRSNGFNLIGDPVGTEDMTGRTDLDLVGVDPMLEALADNGGPTQTHALGVGSPAQGAVTSALLCRREDQRGVARAAPCDVGAYEVP
jgi:hypothetical protein